MRLTHRPMLLSPLLNNLSYSRKPQKHKGHCLPGLVFGKVSGLAVLTPEHRNTVMPMILCQFSTRLNPNRLG